MTDHDEDDRIRRAEKRRDMKKPSSIRRRNKGKRRGLLSFHWPDGWCDANQRRIDPEEKNPK